MKRLFLLGMALLVVILAGLAWSQQDRLVRAWKANTLFDADEIAGNFLSMNEIFESRSVAAAGTPSLLVVGSEMSLPEQFPYRGRSHDTEAWLNESGTTGLLVWQRGKIRFEQYYQGHGPERTHISWSVAKSMVSALIGIAIADGLIDSVSDPVERYAAELKGTAYEGVSLKDVLQMSSGVAFNEDYADPESDIGNVARMAAVGGSFNAYAQQLEQDVAPGSHNRYSSYDTQVLAMVIRGASGQPLSDYMSKKLWQPMGAEGNGQWILDSEGMEMGFGGFNARLRDYLRFGLLYLHRGFWHNQQIVPTDWIEESLHMDAPHLQPGVNNPYSDSVFGYGYQWWMPPKAQGDFLAIGVYNQYIFISPRRELVIVKNSAYPEYYDGDGSTFKTLALFEAIAQRLKEGEQNE